MLTNARSLAPKISSLLTMFDELGLHFALITESWLKDGAILDRDIIDLEHGSDLGILYRNRPKRPTSARQVGGGVSVVYSKSRCSFKERRVVGNRFEMVAAVGRVAGIAREIAIFCIYIEPRMKAADLSELNELLANEILRLKAVPSKQPPLFFIGGDLNRRDLGDAFHDFNDIKQINFEPTRGDACLDIMFSNATFTKSEIFPPLHTIDGTKSDHLSVVLSAREEIVKDFVWIRKKARKFTTAASDAFADRISNTNWPAILGEGSSDTLVSRFEQYTCGLVDELFPFKTVRIRSNEKPWVTDGARALAKRKRRVYRREGKSRLWMRLQTRMDELAAHNKTEYVARVEGSGCSRSYFTAVKNLACKDQPKKWEVGSLFPDCTPEAAGNKIASYFTRISDEFRPIDRVPPAYFRDPVTEEEVAKKLSDAKKPSSAVRGDILPHLMKKHHALLVKPVTTILNKVFETARWPTTWKSETAVIIPKTSNPSSLAECRNISCTNFLSKVLETILLEDLRKEIPPDLIQYGGVKGTSVDHLLVDAWERILEPMERGEHAVMLSIDYQKAFNRLDRDFEARG